MVLTGGKKKMFMTIPRFLDGVPASLVTVSHRDNSESPLLAPYPDWSWHTEGKCSGVTSAFRMQVRRRKNVSELKCKGKFLKF